MVKEMERKEPKKENKNVYKKLRTQKEGKKVAQCIICI